MTVRFGSMVAAVVLVYVSASADQPRDYGGNCTDAGCHAEYTKRPVVHGPVSQGACDSCHEPKERETHKFPFDLAAPADGIRRMWRPIRTGSAKGSFGIDMRTPYHGTQSQTKCPQYSCLCRCRYRLAHSPCLKVGSRHHP